LEERKANEFINHRNNDTFFSNTDQKSTNQQMMMIDTHLIPDEIFNNDHRLKALIDKNATEMNSLKKNNQDLSTAVKILNSYVQAIQNRNFSQEKDHLDYKEKNEKEKKKLTEENTFLHAKVNQLKLQLLKVYQSVKSYEKNQTESIKENNESTLQLLKENELLRDLNEKTTFNNIIVEKEQKNSSETNKNKSNDEIIKEYKKSRRRNQSEVPFDHLSNSSMNTSIIKDTSQRFNKFIFSKKDFLFEEMNNKSMNNQEINVNYIKFGDTIKHNPTSNDVMKTRKQFLFLKTPKGLSNL